MAASERGRTRWDCSPVIISCPNRPVAFKLISETSAHRCIPGVGRLRVADVTAHGSHERFEVRAAFLVC